MIGRRGRRALAVAAALFLAGAVLLWLGPMPILAEDVCDFGTVPEGTSATSGPAWSPPGAIECEYTTPGGRIVRTTYVPWFEWLALGIAALGAGLVAFLVVGAKPGTPRMRYR